MIKCLIYSAIVICLFSCGYRTLEGRVKPIYFTADDTLFSDTTNPVQTVWHITTVGELEGSAITEVELKKSDTVISHSSGPAMVHKGGYDHTLIYPKEQIHVGGDYKNDDYTFSIMNGSPQRNRELLFFKTFRHLEKWPTIPTYIINASLDTILYLERNQKDKIEKANAASKLIFDSLIKAYGISKKFKKLTSDYIQNRYDGTLLWIYTLYKDTLAGHGLYFNKLRELIPTINAIKEKSKFNNNARSYINEMVTWLFPTNMMRSMGDEVMFRACFDSVENNFTGLARDYLLSRIVYRAYAKGLEVPPAYIEKYRRYSLNKTYRKIVKNTKKQRHRNEKDSKEITNMLLASDGKTTLSLEGLLAQNKGKLIVIDLWASWCIPCLKEMPYVKQLVEKYPADQIVFFIVSLDKEAINWRKTIYGRELQSFNNYLLLNAVKTSFYKQYEINTIPRYLLFDKEGKMINDNLPLPSNPELVALLNELVLHN